MNLKKLLEMRNDKVLALQGMMTKAKTEERAMTAEEMTSFETLEAEITNLDKTIKAEERAQKLTLNVVTDDKKEELRAEEVEERAFANYIRSIALEERAETLSKGANGAVIPKTIAAKIIEKVKDISTIYQKATKYNAKGELVFPVYDETTEKITMAYANEFSALTSTSGKFTSVSLTGFLAGALTKVSLSLVNNSDFDLVNYVIGKMAEAIADWLDKECLVGTSAKMTGALSTTLIKTTASGTAFTADELIGLKLAVKKLYQANANFIMHPDTYELVAKMKDGQNNYLVINDFTTGFEPRLLGKPVELDENMPTIALGAKAILYGDFSGLAVKIAEDVNIQVLKEKYADEHALGVIAWVEVDSKVLEPQKIAVLTMKAS